VVPCAITAGSVATKQTAIGNKVEYVHPVFTYTDSSISTFAICGAIVYELVGGNNAYLKYTASSRKIVFEPTTVDLIGNHAHAIRATSSNFTKNQATRNFTVKGLTPCTLIPTVIPTLIGHVGETVTHTIIQYGETATSFNCGSHVYSLVGGNTAILNFNSATRVLTLNTVLHADVGTTSAKIRAYGSNW